MYYIFKAIDYVLLRNPVLCHMSNTISVGPENLIIALKRKGRTARWCENFKMLFHDQLQVKLFKYSTQELSNFIDIHFYLIKRLNKYNYYILVSYHHFACHYYHHILHFFLIISASSYYFHLLARSLMSRLLSGYIIITIRSVSSTIQRCSLPPSLSCW